MEQDVSVVAMLRMMKLFSAFEKKAGFLASLVSFFLWSGFIVVDEVYEGREGKKSAGSYMRKEVD